MSTTRQDQRRFNLLMWAQLAYAAKKIPIGQRVSWVYLLEWARIGGNAAHSAGIKRLFDSRDRHE